ncbi:aminotransferase class I/II-fold pyridoxal phosphate-dependent enzyme [Desulfatirhabdium butyrativorans]|uniref:aminotransferase class I/II-fold pyridoxal phosphate-dependent enzyme n=1 Tax=Desulfatirhabdium butyrativorans TaxID=340467 RepID=UPI00040A795E|nr:aminotransferase class I/II-fold pyridoxal phosphate-dependent enzyme [Desulfatirhabdium butyrativorans]
MNPLAQELNQTLTQQNPHILDMLSRIGRNLFFPKGILSQSAEAKEKAHRLNATIGIATERGGTMHLASVMQPICGMKPENSLTYAPSFGLPQIRSQWKASLFEKNPSLQGKAISLPVVTCGITHAISVFADVWIDPEDVIVFPDMMWGNYNLILNVRKGATIVQYPMFDANWGFNVDALSACLEKQAAEHGKIVVFLNFPNNPTGYTVNRDEADRIVSVLHRLAQSGKNVIAVLDDAYFGLFYEPETVKESLFARLAGLDPRLLAVKLDGATKEHFVWGLRVGFITYGISGLDADGYLVLEKKTAGAVRGSISNASHLSQSIVLSAFGNPESKAQLQGKFETLKRRANRVKAVLSDPKYRDAWDVYPFNSGYFMCLKLKTVDAETLRVHLLNQYGVGLISIGKTDLRVAFSCLEEDDIQTLFDLVLQGIQDLTKGR